MRIFTILLALSISGCSTLGISTPVFLMDADQSIGEFIYGNFSGWGPDRFVDKEGKLKRGVIYKAPFNKLNKTYLKKPKNDLTKFCGLKGGSLSLFSLADHNLIDELTSGIKSPLQAMFESMFFSLSKGASEKIAWDAGIIGYKQRLAENSHGHVRNKIMASTALSQAVRSGLLGAYKCSVNGTVTWKVTIDLEAVKVRNTSKNLINVPMAYIRIRGW